MTGTLLAEFDNAESAARALAQLRSQGVRRVETYGPFPLTAEDAYAPRGSFLLAFLALTSGVLGLLVAYGIQWYVNVRSYPLNIGGRPTHAIPAFIPVTFETTILCAAIAICAGFLLTERLPRLWQPIFAIEGFERASVDRFWIAVELGGSTLRADSLARGLMLTHPLRVLVSEEPV